MGYNHGGRSEISVVFREKCPLSVIRKISGAVDYARLFPDIMSGSTVMPDPADKTNPALLQQALAGDESALACAFRRLSRPAAADDPPAARPPALRAESIPPTCFRKHISTFAGESPSMPATLRPCRFISGSAWSPARG